MLALPPNSLSRLRELKASKEVVCVILQCPCDKPGWRPLETIKGVQLTGSTWDHVFLASLKKYGANALKRLELAGWNEMDDLRRLVECVPKLTWLDVGKRGGPGAANTPQTTSASKPVTVINTNAVEWATLLSNMPELTTFYGVRFFYEVSALAADPSILSLSDRSRVRKNDEVASVFAWKCPKLRRLDHWEEGSGKVIVLLRDGEKIRYEVRRVKV
ncbi:hypothetical protein SCP_1502660 [Sparassis crispa]|uniref:F-box domain-containing protein n=1 Tax=Sparassis crispa TaxID=139825 RepID=A0A401H4A5_9APHY|nr:hypothetical protein SCP_1502660 [Sparassis crispa]GBE89258.1 hypothetical protein SCP_1502660 [Sparassis crispa]